MPSQEDPKKLLESEYPIEIRKKIRPAVNHAYKMVNILSEDEEWISWVGAKDLLVHLRIFAVQFKITELIDDGELPSRFHYKIARNVADNCSHVEIVSDRSVMTISHVSGEKQIPRRAEFRANKGISNQMVLDLGLEEFTRRTTDRFYVLLTHGGSDNPEFVNIGIPDAFVQTWVHRINLLKEPHLLPVTDSEKIQDPRELMNFKSKVEGALKQDG